MKLLKTLKYWYTFASKVWVSLALGWFAVVIGLTCYLRLDRAGALLICGVIIAEVFHKKRHRIFVEHVQPGINTSYLYLEVDNPEKETKDIEITAEQTSSGRTIINTDDWTIYQLAKPKEFRTYSESRMWNIDQTMVRLENTVDYFIVVSAIAGTVLWAFF